MSTSPLVTRHQLDDVLVWRPAGPVTVREFIGKAQAIAASLPATRWVINLCEDRYHFALTLAACAMSGRVSLQPASQSAETLAWLTSDHPGAVCLAEHITVTDTRLRPCLFPAVDDLPAHPVHDIPRIDDSATVAMLFTSGSTGMPQAHRKTWGKLVRNGRTEAEALGVAQRPHAIVGTVPAQHSYGFESTFLIALHGGCSFWSGKPFYAQDIAQALAAVPQPRMLVTTPFHLSNLVAASLPLPAVDLLLSATAPLSLDLARRAEQALQAPLHEIYGSTESSALACRRTLDGATWQLMAGVTLEQSGEITHASGGHVEQRVPLSDSIELLDGGRQFLLHGRHSDLVNIAGKRTSLAYLNHQICAIEGVLDAAFFLPDETSPDGVTRLAAFVVAPALDNRTLMTALRQRVDAIFLPRPLLRLDALPRNSTGKLPRQTLQALYLERQAHVPG
ncbi:AMP-binding protein [Hydrogenophaga aquatica]